MTSINSAIKKSHFKRKHCLGDLSVVTSFFVRNLGVFQYSYAAWALFCSLF